MSHVDLDESELPADASAALRALEAGELAALDHVVWWAERPHGATLGREVVRRLAEEPEYRRWVYDTLAEAAGHQVRLGAPSVRQRAKASGRPAGARPHTPRGG